MGGMHKTVKVPIRTTEELWPTETIAVIQQVMEEGAAKGKSGWEKDKADYHAMKAYDHLFLYFNGGDKNEDHLAHAFTRLMMALAIRDGHVEGGEE